MTVLYSEVRDEIKTGDLIATDSRVIDSFFGLVLFLYQKILGVDYTHVGVAVRMCGRVFVVEATPPEVRLVPLTMMGDFYLVKAGMQEDNKEYSEYLFDALGKPYSLTDMAKGTMKFSTSGEDFYCSELAAAFYRAFGHVVDDDAGISPDSIVAAVMKKSGATPVKVILDKGNLK